MNGHTAPPPRRSSRGRVIALRVIFTAIALLSAGMLAWVPMLRLAIVRRRLVDWVLFVIVLVGGLVAMTLPSFVTPGSWQATLDAVTLLLISWGVAAYFLRADIGDQSVTAAHPSGPQAVPGRPPHPPAHPHPHPPVDQNPTLAAADPARSPALPPERMEQVRAELSELSDYLRNKDVW